jgi:hypothetical protein
LATLCLAGTQYKTLTAAAGVAYVSRISSM